MHLFTAILSISALGSTAFAAVNTTQEYYLKSSVKPHQHHKSRFDNLYFVSYHTGAGLDDATFNRNISIASKGFLNDTRQEFVLGEFPSAMIMDVQAGTYNGWDPVRVNAGDGGDSPLANGFFLNETGLQWNSAPGEDAELNQFGGWLVCDWWHGVPQLFFRLSYENLATPCSCADIELHLQYI